jgi:hypothetical protein
MSRSILAAVLFVLAATGAAQTPPQTGWREALTSAIRHATAQNPRVREAEARVEAARRRVPQAAVQNGLVLVSQTRSLLAEGRPFQEALREASIGRVRPKLMTAGTAILGLLPLLVLRLHGSEIERPLAVVMIGGLVTSTLFTLLALPTFYQLVHQTREQLRNS